jgi:hypothetical protein
VGRFQMDGEQSVIFEICIGGVLVGIGFILHWWSTQLLWILIHPSPVAKQFVESLPFVFWIIGALLVVDSIRRMMKQKIHR